MKMCRTRKNSMNKKRDDDVGWGVLRCSFDEKREVRKKGVGGRGGESEKGGIGCF